IWSSYWSESKPIAACSALRAVTTRSPSDFGNVNEMSVSPVAAADTFCTIMSRLAGLGHGREDLGGLARHVGHADDRDLRLAEVARHTGDDRLLHRFPFLRVDDPGAFGVVERG